MDNKLGKTKVLSQINAFAGIDRYNRQSDQGIVQFIAEFDLRYNTCVAAGIKLPTSVVAYMLLFRAELDHTQYQLIKGVIDLNKESENDNLYEKVKEKMRDMLTDSLGKGAFASFPNSIWTFLSTLLLTIILVIRQK